MKLLCISDQIDPLVYTASIKERFKDVDMILSAGDLPQDYLEFIVTTLNKPLLSVYGNHELEGYHFLKHGSDPSSPWLNMEQNVAFRSGAIHIGSRVKREGGLLFMGLGGSMRYNSGDNQYTDFQMWWEIIRLVPRLLFNRFLHGRYLDILLTHAPPLGIHDKEDRCHRGFKPFLWFMRIFKPKYLIHGHIHLYDLADVRLTRYFDTFVINAYSHYIIDTKDYTAGDEDIADKMK
jgi:Icc-related predicted phosphoesterase